MVMVLGGSGTANGITSFSSAANFNSNQYVTGNLGVGTSTPSYKLHVTGGEVAFGRVDSSAEGGQLNLTRASDDSTIYAIDVYGTGSSPSFRMFNTTNPTVFFQASVNGVNYIRFDPAQSASGDANALDDYEEGTWTPALPGSPTYGTRIATYTKIGDTVRCYFDITITSIGTGSAIYLSGFPFSATYNDGGSVSYWTSLATSVYFLTIQMNGVQCIFPGTTASGSTITNGVSVFGNGSRIIGTVVYKTAT